MNLASEMVVSSVAGALKVIGKFVDETDFEMITDKVLNGVESFFKDDSMLDEVAETIAGGIRKQLNVEDSNPDN